MSDPSGGEILMFFFIVSVAGLAGVYGSRYFTGWPAQIAGGFFIAIFTFVVIIATLNTINRFLSWLGGLGGGRGR